MSYQKFDTWEELADATKAWGDKHDLHDPVMQFTKMVEESGEIAHELTRNRFNSTALEDALGDTAVCLIILAHILDLDLKDCLEIAYNEIKDRKGATKNGTFIKEA